MNSTHNSTLLRARVLRWASICFAICLVVSPRQNTWAAEKKEGFLSYLFKMMYADDDLAPPELNADEREDLQKMEIMLNAQNDRSQSGANLMLMGVFAASRGDNAQALRYMQSASCSMPASPLPATMTAQVYAQAGDLCQARRWHQMAQERVGCSSCGTTLLSSNTQMDLAVVSAKLGDQCIARQQLNAAQMQLLQPSSDRVQAATGWLQIGNVFATTLADREGALHTWKNGVMALSGAPRSTTEVSLKLDLNLRVAEEYVRLGDAECADQYLQCAAQTVEMLAPQFRPKANLRIGQSYARLAEQNPHEPAYSQGAARHLAPLADQNEMAPENLVHARDAALTQAKRLKLSDPAEAQKLTVKALRQTLQIGERDSAYEPLFSTLSDEALNALLPALEQLNPRAKQ